jgi:hypothetical protein
MWEAEKDDDASFERRLDSVVREIGDRGKVLVSEAVPPAAASRVPAPAPAPAPALTPAPAPALTPTPAPAPAPAPAPMTQGAPASISPSLALAAPPQPQPQPATSVTTASSFAEVVSFMREEREEAKAERTAMESKLAEQRAEMDTKLESKLAEQRAEMDAKLEELTASQKPVEAFSLQQVEAVMERVEALHAAKLLADDELFAVEDAIADYLQAKASFEVVTMELISANPALGMAQQLVVLNEGMPKDAMLARQIRRKLTAGKEGASMR